jgi:hypothetical protein
VQVLDFKHVCSSSWETKSSIAHKFRAPVRYSDGP